VANKIAEEPAFKWWVSFCLQKRNRIINKAKSKYWRTTHKYGIKVPKTAEEALRLDKINGNDYWERAIKKEMSKVRVHPGRGASRQSSRNDWLPRDHLSSRVRRKDGLHAKG
jgi:hypothetical protein